MNIKAVIFDMDGLLIDSETVWDEARQLIAAEAGRPWTQADHIRCMGVSTDTWAAYMIERLELSMSLAELRERVIDHIAAHYEREIPFRPQAVRVVKWSAARYPTALASGSPRRLIDIVTQADELRDCFQEILVADEVGEGKPHPAVYLEAARRLGVEPRACLCLEDSPNGVLSGHRAGMIVINVPDPRYPLTAEEAAYADLVLESLDEFSAETVQQMSALRGVAQ
ncbi:MAG: HAD family phosphatase [Candidatus Promineifilaceae bacterium]|nr:HAD family phosphatase [Candidatus Promineifilaceae bacterium]